MQICLLSVYLVSGTIVDISYSWSYLVLKIPEQMQFLAIYPHCSDEELGKWVGLGWGGGSGSGTGARKWDV